MMSFWVVPLSAVRSTPFSSATVTYRASSQAAVALIVIDVFISSSGIPSRSACMSPLFDDRDADLPDLAAREDVIRVVPGLRRQVEGDREAGLALGQVAPVELVRAPGVRVPGVGAHDPGTVGLGQAVLGHTRSLRAGGAG